MSNILVPDAIPRNIKGMGTGVFRNNMEISWEVMNGWMDAECVDECSYLDLCMDKCITLFLCVCLRPPQI